MNESNIPLSIVTSSFNTTSTHATEQTLVSLETSLTSEESVPPHEPTLESVDLNIIAEEESAVSSRTRSKTMYHTSYEPAHEKMLLITYPIRDPLNVHP